MKVLVSACLLGDNCKYDGGNNRNESVIKFVADHKVAQFALKSWEVYPLLVNHRN